MTEKMIEKIAGLPSPESNFHPIPNEWIDVIARMTTLAEVKVVNYLLRHTWGFQERDIPLHVTVDEFVNGRVVSKEIAKIKGYPIREGKHRMDLGTQLSDKSVRNGLQEAIKRGLVIEYVNNRDKARIDKYYLLLIKGKNVFVNYRGAKLTDRCIETIRAFGYQENANGYFELMEKEDIKEDSVSQHLGGVKSLPQDVVGGEKILQPYILGEKNLHPQDIGGGEKILPPRGEDFTPRTDKDNYININNNLSIIHSVSNNSGIELKDLSEPNNQNLNALKDRMKEDGRIRIIKSESNERIIGLDHENDLKDVIAYANKKLYGLIPESDILKMENHWISWIGSFGVNRVKYAIERLAEQKNVKHVIRWMLGPLQDPNLYPPKIALNKSEQPTQNPAEQKKKNLMRSMYL